MRRAARAQPAHIPAKPTPSGAAAPGAYTGQDAGISFEVPLRTGRGQNDREHWRVRAKRVEREKQAVLLAAAAYEPVPGCRLDDLLAEMARRGPVVVTLTRIAPSGGLDEEDNLTGSLKAIRDAMAKVLGLPNDRAPERVTWKYKQVRGPWAVRIEVSARKPEVQGPGWTAEEWALAGLALKAAAALKGGEVGVHVRSLGLKAEAMARALGGGG